MTQTMIALIVFLIPLAYSPGPGNMTFAALGAQFGLRATLPATAGYHLATLLVTVAIGLGLAGGMARYPAVFGVLRVAGAAYVLWLAWRMLGAGGAKSREVQRRAGFGDGAMLLILNPKAYVIIGLIFAQFLPQMPAGGMGAVLAISVVFTVNNLLAFTLWSAAGQGLAGLFHSDCAARRLNAGFAGMLALVAVWMLLI